MAATRRIARSAGVLALATAVSRVLGFVRDILLAALFGTTLQAQAFVVAFRLPNLLRDLVAEGAMTSAFVPVLSWYRTKKPDEFWPLAQTLACQLGLVVVGLGVVGWLAAEPIVRLIAPGFAADPAKLALTIQLARWLFPFITLVGFWAYFMGLLNTLGHFAMPALGPAILNLAMIAACLWVVPHVTPGILAVAIGVLVGGVVQLLIQWPVAHGLGFRWQWRWRHPGSSEILRLLGPRMFGAAAYQVNVLVDTMLASLSGVVGNGAVAAIYYANRLVQLPLALFGTASAQASLPALAELAAHQDWAGFRRTLQTVLRMVGFVLLPSAVGLIVLASPIVEKLLQRGAFDVQDTAMTANALRFYSVGLLAYALTKVLTGAFYALKDTRTSVRLMAQAVALNIALSLALMWPMRLSGLALASSLANIFNAYRLTRALERRLQRPLLDGVVRIWLRMSVAALAMGAVCGVGWHAGGLAAWPAWAGLPAAIGLGLLSYAAACRLCAVQELDTVTRWISQALARRFKPQ